MYYYYYYYSETEINFKFENEKDILSLNDFEELIHCFNQLNQCIIDSTPETDHSNINNDIRVSKISYNSPLDLILTIPLEYSVIGAPFLLLKLIERIIRLKMDMEKHQNELSKLKFDTKEKMKGRTEIDEKQIQKTLEKILKSKRFKEISKKEKKLSFNIINIKIKPNKTPSN